jgi:hypothetical protein
MKIDPEKKEKKEKKRNRKDNKSSVSAGHFFHDTADMLVFFFRFYHGGWVGGWGADNRYPVFQ